ncbi:hypothetical protein Patl1_18476 [Pistacia atlantica]|uniref:Uncharacterized protein n=1 Tax=Pistacia atlantica TaxID=434234 RepID=A0ACC1C0W2_9ROSI|nr:hypothetical protein Patl1_18476 [Pistacia atlantica]
MSCSCIPIYIVCVFHVLTFYGIYIYYHEKPWKPRSLNNFLGLILIFRISRRQKFRVLQVYTKKDLDLKMI